MLIDSKLLLNYIFYAKKLITQFEIIFPNIEN